MGKSDVDPTLEVKNENTETAIKIENTTFSWGVTANDESTPMVTKAINNLTRKTKGCNDNDRLTDPDLIEENKADLYRPTLSNVTIEINKGELIGIIGKVGSGKTTLLQAILNNLIILDSEPKSIEVNGSMAYCSQNSWIQNNTIKNNILYNSNYDAFQYRKILNLCELESDISQFTAGDLTEIGEKGVNLSGGQKARISIARAVYSDKDIYLFDDPISALDAHVGENIMKRCFVDYLKGKTRLLVTHALQYLHHMDRIVYISNGSIEWIGNYAEIKKQQFYSELVRIAEHRQTEISEKLKRESFCQPPIEIKKLIFN